MGFGKNPVVHFEIGCKNQYDTHAFYEACFNWNITNTGTMDEVDTKSELGINGHITSLVTEIEHYLMFYIQVDEIQTTLDTIEKEGGKTVVPVVDLPEGRKFAWFEDITGNKVGLITK